jgi:hypothetical protein
MPEFKGLGALNSDVWCSGIARDWVTGIQDFALAAAQQLFIIFPIFCRQPSN